MLAAWLLPYPVAGLYDLAQGQGYLPSNWYVLSILIPTWLSRLWLIGGVILFLVVTFEGAYRIAHKSRKEQSRVALEIIGGIRNDIYSGKILLEKLKKAKGLDKYLKKEYNDWIDLVGKCMQTEQYSEWFGWFVATHTRPDATLQEVIDACDRGITRLLSIHAKLTNSSMLHKVDSQTE